MILIDSYYIRIISSISSEMGGFSSPSLLFSICSCSWRCSFPACCLADSAAMCSVRLSCSNIRIAGGGTRSLAFLPSGRLFGIILCREGSCG